MSELERLVTGALSWRLGDPAALAALLTVVALAAAAGAMGLVRRARLLRRSFGRLAPEVAPGARQAGRAARLVVLCAGLASLSIGAARPQRGVHVAEARVPALDLAVVVDASRSMLARDAAPDRLTVARAALVSLLDRLGADRVAVIAFAGDARVESPLTPDRRAAALALDAIGPDELPRQGTNLAAALEAARRALGRGAGDGLARAVLLVSDGEDHGEDAAAAADRLALGGVTLLTAGVGTREGAGVPREDGAGFLTQDGRAVVSRLDATRLADLAARGGGRYAQLGDPGAVDELAAALERIRSAGSRTARIAGWDERPEPFAAAGLALLLLSVVPVPLVHGPARAGPASTPRGRSANASHARATAAVAVCALAAMGVSPFLAEHDGLAAANALALRDPAAALPLFDEVEREVGRQPEIAVDRGLALFRAGRVEEARRAFELPARTRGPLASRAAYAEGVAASSVGDEEGAVTAWRRALVLDPANGAARFNLEVVLRRRAERRAHPQPRAGGAGEERGAAASEGGADEGAAGPQPSPLEGKRLRPRRDAPGRGGPMSVAEAERLLDEVAAGERIAPRGARARRPAPAANAW